jgi:hypothetical protein
VAFIRKRTLDWSGRRGDKKILDLTGTRIQSSLQPVAIPTALSGLVKLVHTRTYDFVGGDVRVNSVLFVEPNRDRKLFTSRETLRLRLKVLIILTFVTIFLNTKIDLSVKYGKKIVETDNALKIKGKCSTQLFNF